MPGRIRTIKPEWLEDEKMMTASPAARVLSIGLILVADDYGRGCGNPDLVVPRIFPRHSREGSQAFQELLRLGYFTLYVVRGQTFFQIVNWSKHQRVDKPGKQRIPGPSDDSATPVGTVEKVRGSLAPDQDQDQDLNIERSRVRGRTPTPLSESSKRLADYLRKKIIEAQPKHRLYLSTYWTESKRKAWAKTCDLLLRVDEREPHQVRAVLDWTFGAQGGGDGRLVVESPEALR